MQRLEVILDDLADRIRQGQGTEAVSALCDDLRRRRASTPPDRWEHDVISVCRQHPIQAILLEDPYTARAFLKPRGYAGDAVMLDYVYTGTPPPDTSAVGRAVFRGTTGLSNGQSVVARRDLLAHKIDEAAAARPDARVLSIACGHLREANRSAAVANKSVSDFVALDQDTESLAVVARDFSAAGIRAVHGSVIDIIRGRVSFSGFDLVYAAGLFDYLNDAFARRLLGLMARMLRAGGHLLVANFTPANHGRGYMECFMDWHLICRDEAQMSGLLEGVDTGSPETWRMYRDEFNNIVYLEAARA